MKDIVVGIVLGVICLGLTVLVGFGTREVWRDHDRLRDFEDWTSTTGQLESLTVVETLYRSAWQYRIECEYSYVAEGATRRSTVCDLSQPYFDSPAAAILFIESAIRAQDALGWKAAQRGGLDIWVAAAEGRAVRVRHSIRHPDSATLTDRPPLPSTLSWVVIGVLALLTLLFGLATVAFAIMPFVPESVPGTQPGEAAPKDGGP